jgi:hypothetical protein
MQVTKKIQVAFLSDAAVFNILGLFLSGPHLSMEVTDITLTCSTLRRMKYLICKGGFILPGQLCWASHKK